MAAIYDVIGRTYANTRTPDPRIAAAIAASLAGFDSILNVGAGTGSYESKSEGTVALEPSLIMIRQRPPDAAPVVCARAEALPFAAHSFDAVSCVLTVHHWSDRERGMAECGRVARERVVFFTIDASVLSTFWLFDYFPGLIAIDREIFPPLECIAQCFGDSDVKTVMIPHDCRDGFLGAFWRRPHAYLDAAVRAGISTFGRVQTLELATGLKRLASELESESWHRAQAGILQRQELDLGYRIVSCRP